MKSFFGRLAPVIFTLCLMLVALAPVGLAQSLDTVTFTGRIVDSNNAPIVGASVTATLTTTGVERTVVSDEDGRYRIGELQPGNYTLKSSSQGFGTQSKIDLVTIAGQNVQLDFTLVPGDVRAEQTVTIGDDDAPAVDTTRTVVGGTVTQREIEELPNNNRTPLDFVFTLGGVTEEPLSVRDAAEDRAFGTSTSSDPRPAPLESGIFSLSGGAAYSNNITIDGLDNNDDRLAQERFQPSIDAIAEVQVITNQFSAEYGRASGGRVNIRTRGGTKKFRGRAYMYYRNSDFNANTYNNNLRGLEKLPFTDYNPGFTFGGPIPVGYFKNRTFFFSSYEYDKFLDTTLIDTIVPVAQNPNLALPAPNGGNQRTEATRNIFGGFTPALVGSFTDTLATPSLKHIFTQRIDHKFTDKHNVTFTFELGNSRNNRQFRNALNRLEEAIQGPTRDTTAYKFIDSYVFNSKIVNEFRFQNSKFTPTFASTNPTDPVVLISLNDNTSLSTIDQRNGTLIAGNSTASQNYNFPGTRRETRYQFQDTLTAIYGNHSFRFGADVQNINSQFADLQDATGTFNFVSVRAFLDNRISQYRRNFGQSADQKNTYSGFFVQDEWRARPNVTLSFGLRYERESIVSDNNNFGPRAAIAYSPFKDGKGVIRVGGGIFFNRVLLRTFDDANLSESRVAFNSTSLAGPSNFNTDNCYSTPTAATLSDYNSPKCAFLRQVQFPNVLTLEDLRRIEASLPLSSTGVRSTGFTDASSNLRRIDPNIKIPESYQFNVGFEREIFKSVVLEANYTFNKTVHLFREFNINGYRLPDGFVDYNDYLLRGNKNSAFVFFNGDPNDAVGTTTSSGVTRVNLASKNVSTAANAPIGIARAQLQAQLGRRLNNNLNDNIDQVASIGNSLYNGLTVELRKRYRKFGYGFGGTFRAVYTLSKLLDDGLNNTTNAQSDGDFASEWSLGRQDRRHTFALSGTFDMPNWLLGLKLSPILRLGSSSRFDLGNGGYDRNLNDNSNDRPNFSGNLDDIVYREPGDPYPQSLIDQLSLAPIGSAGNLPRNAGRGPKLFLFDMNFSREFRFTERFRLRPNVEVDNILNSRVFTYGSEFIDLGLTGVTQPTFLIPTRTLRPRQIRLGIRFDF